jgi:hypothetical protein
LGDVRRRRRRKRNRSILILLSNFYCFTYLSTTPIHGEDNT